MKEIGEFLRNSRLEKGMSLQDISHITKISTRYLEGIEKGDWSMMPGSFYVKGFIRNYAKVLGVDISEYLEALSREVADSTTPVSPITSTTSAPVRANRFGKLFSTSLVIILVSVVLFVVFRYVSEMDVGENDPGPVNPEANNNQQYEPPELEPLPEKDPEPETPEPENVAEIELAEQVQNTYTFHVKNATDIKLRMQVEQGESWYQVREGNAQGAVKQEGKIQNGQVLEFASENGLWVRLGNFRPVSVYVNDQLIETEDTTNSTSVRNFQFEFVSQ